jgi:UDP-N-acetylmuramate--alanine ligase
MNPKNADSDLIRRLTPLAPFHFIGVGGSGMLPLAELVASLGLPVTGSDLKNTQTSSRISCLAQDSAEERSAVQFANCVVFSSAIPKNSKNFIFAKESGKTLLHRSDLLAIFCNTLKTIAVSGTHGKTTTSAMIAHILESQGVAPSWIIGASFSNGQPAFKLGTSNLMVIEADESDGTFVKYRPFVAVVNNVEADHMDFYKTEDRLFGAFSEFLSNTSDNGCLIFNADDTALKGLAAKSGKPRKGFGSDGPSEFRLLHARSTGLSTSGELSAGGRNVTFKIPMTGRHNAFNALAAVAACVAVGLEAGACASSLQSFPGVARRLQAYKNNAGAMIFDDYAHNPGKIKSCLEGLFSAFPEKRVIAVFQPHRFSRISSLYRHFIRAFRFPNLRVVVLPVYGAGEVAIDGFSVDKIADDIRLESGAQTFAAYTLKEAADLVKSMMDPKKDIIVTIGAGDVWNVANDVAERL